MTPYGSMNTLCFRNPLLLVTGYLRYLRVSLKSTKHGFDHDNGSISMDANTRPPHLFLTSAVCPRLIANGLCKWPIAESLCNCVIRFHTFQSSNSIRMCRCALMFFLGPLCVCPRNGKRAIKGQISYAVFCISLRSAPRVEVVLNEMWLYALCLSQMLCVRIHTCVCEC